MRGTWSLSAIDSASHSMVYSATNLPPGLSIDSSTGAISGTIDSGASAVAPYTVTVSAADSVNSAVGASATFQWAVHPDVTLTDRGATTNAQGDTVYVALAATDSAGNGVNYGAVNLPPGLSIDPLTGLISGTVSGSAHAGSPYAVTVTATDRVDSAASAAESYTWTIDASGSVTVSVTSPARKRIPITTPSTWRFRRPIPLPTRWYTAPPACRPDCPSTPQRELFRVR